MLKDDGFPYSDVAQEVFSGVCVGNALRKATRIVSRAYDEALAPLGLTIGQFSIMAHIETMTTPSVQTLADKLEMNQSALSRGLRPLEQAGFVISCPDETDRRRRFLALSNQGREKFNTAANTWKRVQDHFSQHFGEEQLAALRRDLKHLSSGL